MSVPKMQMLRNYYGDDLSSLLQLGSWTSLHDHHNILVRCLLSLMTD